MWGGLDFHLGLLRDACRRGFVDMHDADTVDSVPLVGIRLVLAEEDVAEVGPAVIAHRLVLRRRARGEWVRRERARKRVGELARGGGRGEINTYIK